MKTDLATWPTLSKLLDDWLDQPTDSRSRWLRDLGPEYSDVLAALRQLLATQASAADDFLKTLPKFPQSPEPLFSVETGDEVGPYPLNREEATLARLRSQLLPTTRLPQPTTHAPQPSPRL
jgi:hypothetical protein